MKAYESEMERIAAITTEIALKKFGFKYEKKHGAQKSSFGRSDHKSDLCEACKLNICDYKNRDGRARVPRGQRREMLQAVQLADI